MERETGIEPASLAWKARALPLNYSRIGSSLCDHPLRQGNGHSQYSLTGGGDWIRTSVGVSQQIYSLPPLATRAPLRRISNYSTTFLACWKLQTYIAYTLPHKHQAGAAGGDRTHDPWLRRPILYPLSYSRVTDMCSLRLLHAIERSPTFRQYAS